VGVIPLPVAFMKVIARVLSALTRQPTIPSPACVVGLETPVITSPARKPGIVKVCSADVFAATSAGERVRDATPKEVTFPVIIPDDI
jgi:hypothetical protein